MFDAMWRNEIKRNIVVANAFKSFKHFALFLRETLRVKNPTHELLKNKNLLEEQTLTRFRFSVSAELNRSKQSWTQNGSEDSRQCQVSVFFKVDF